MYELRFFGPHNETYQLEHDTLESAERELERVGPSVERRYHTARVRPRKGTTGFDVYVRPHGLVFKHLTDRP